MSLLDFDGDEEWDRALARQQRRDRILDFTWMAFLVLLGTLAGFGAAYLTGLTR